MSDGRIQGYASTFGPPADSYGDIIAKGAFAKSLAAHQAAGTSPLMLWAHDAGSVPIGTWTALKEDQNGLWVEGRLNLEIPKAAEVLSALKAKSTAGMSIGFRTPKGGRVPSTKAGEYELREIDLVEISLVNIPANSRARVTAAKSQSLLTFVAAAAQEIRNSK